MFVEEEVMDSTALHKLGEIEVLIEMGTQQSKSCVGKPFVRKEALLEPGVVNERSKKAAVHQIQFGQARYSEKKNDLFFTKRKGSLDTTFIFKYRPLGE